MANSNHPASKNRLCIEHLEINKHIVKPTKEINDFEKWPILTVLLVTKLIHFENNKDVYNDQLINLVIIEQIQSRKFSH